MREGDSLNEVSFRSVLVIPPFVVKAFIDSGSAAAEELGHLAAVAGKAFLTEHSEISNVNSLKDKLGDLLLFL